MVRPEPGAVPRRPHHISSIAHLFIQEDGLDNARDPAGEPCDMVVASPGNSPISAFAAAGLALGSIGPATLSEDIRIRWSAGTFLARQDSRTRIEPGRNETYRNTWTISPGSGPPSRVEKLDDSHSLGVREFRWSHLGCLGQTGLSHLESRSVARSLVDLPLNGSAGLVWCLLAKEAGHFSPSYFLGRLVELIRPDRIEILMFPDAWAEAGRPGWLEEISRTRLNFGDPEDLALCAELADRVCKGIPLEIHRVGGSDNLTGSFGGNRELNSLWKRVALGMVAENSGC